VSNRLAVAWLAALLFTAGLIAGLVPVHANEVSCGAAFSGGNFDATAAQFGDDIGDAMSGYDFSKTDYEADCADRRSSQRLLVVPALVLAGLVGGFLLLTANFGGPVSAPTRTETDS
jgi:hypothetical protein